MKKLLISPEKALYKVADPIKVAICEEQGFAVEFQALGITDTDEERTLAIIPLDDSSENVAKRIVVCWNAMDGIDDPAAARVVLDLPQTEHAADMLAALKGMENYARHWLADHGDGSAAAKRCQAVLDAIAKAGG
jgi:hypothetical protein